jgi:thiamine-phosphate diphosphorylase
VSQNRPILMVVTDPTVPDLDTRLDAAIAGGADWVQYRDKGATTHQRAIWVAAFRQRHPQVLVVVNDDIEAARLAGASGVHLSESGPATDAAGQALGPDAVAGCSIHAGSLRAGRWRDRGIGYVTFGTVYPSESHPEQTAVGLGKLKHACEYIAGDRPWLPVLAIGGINADRARACVRVGAHGVAVIRAVLMAPEPAEAARTIVLAMEAVRETGSQRQDL